MAQKFVSQPIDKETNRKLIAISKKRKDNNELVKTKQDILMCLVDVLYKKECK